MRRLLVFAAVVAGAGAAWTAPVPDPAPVRVYGVALAPGDTVPPIKALALDGTPQTVAWSSGKLTLVNFWATWCAPCRQEMPELQALHAARDKDGLRVVGVVVQDRAGGDDIAAAANVAKARYTLLWGGPDVELAWGGVSILPTTFLVDPGGKIVRKYIGTNAEEIAALTRDIDDYLAGRPLGDPYMPPPDVAPAPR